MVIDEKILTRGTQEPTKDGIYLCLVRNDKLHHCIWMALEWSFGKWRSLGILSDEYRIAGYIRLGDEYDVFFKIDR